MEPRLNLVTLGVADFERAVAFYRDALGWPMSSHSVGDVAFFQAGGVILALYPRPLLAEDARVQDSPGSEHLFGGVTLAQNVRARVDVDRVLAGVAAAGGRILKPAEDAFWGGRTGYFADPDGYPWEVAWNPAFPLDREGIVRLEPPRKSAAAPRRRAAARPQPKPTRRKPSRSGERVPRPKRKRS